QRIGHRPPRVVDKTVLASGGEAPHHDFRNGFHGSGELVNGDDGQDKAVFAQMTPVFDHQIFHNVGARTGVDADSAHRDFVDFARTQLVELHYVAALHHQHLPNSAVHPARQVSVNAH